jgi:hypothetical protein
MSEVMAIESVVEAYGKFKGYFCEMRIPFKFRGGYSDLDIVGFNPTLSASFLRITFMGPYSCYSGYLEGHYSKL